jgi:hypothetical protein
MYSEKFNEAYNEGYQILVNPQIVSDVEYLENINDKPTQLAVEKNFTTGSHKIVFVYYNTNEFFDSSDLLNLSLKDNTITQIKIFEDRELIENLYYFDTTFVENSYDSVKKIREEIKNSFSSWFSYNERLLDYCLNCFDGDHDTLLNGISFSPKKEINSLVCHINPSGNFIKYKEIIKNLCYLHGVTTNLEDARDLDDIIKKITPILSEGGLKLSFETSYSKTRNKELNLIIHPIIHDLRHQIVKFASDCLSKEGLLDETTAKQLDIWQLNDTTEAYKDRLKGYIKIKILKDGYVKTEVLSCYGVI